MQETRTNVVNKSDSASPKKRRSTSVLLLVAMLLLGVAGAYWGETMMTYVFLLEGQWKAHQRFTQSVRQDQRPSMGAATAPEQSGGGAERGGFAFDQDAESTLGKRPPAELEVENENLAIPASQADPTPATTAVSPTK